LNEYSITSHTHDHGSLTGLLDNDHPQYTLSADMIGYSLTSHVHPYLPLSGGTLTGPLTGTFAGDGSSLTGIAATASID